MPNSNYSEKEIQWALEELRKKGIENPTQDDAINLLNTFQEFSRMFVDKLKEGKQEKNKNIN